MKSFFSSLLSYYRGIFFSKKFHHVKPTPTYNSCPAQLDDILSTKTIVMDLERALLRSNSMFPYFMLVALEAGSFIRGLLLLLLYPIICCLNQHVGLRVMVMVCFFGIKEKSFTVGRAVLPKFFLEDVGLQGFELLRKAGRKVCFSRMPRKMVEGFLKEYLEVDVVVGGELKVFCGYYNGLMEDYNVVQSLALKELLLDERKIVNDELVGITNSTKSLHHPIFSSCKDIYLVSETEKIKWHPLPRKMYPKPLVFHDGRIAFRPTPLATLAMFLWLPIALPLAILRLIIGVLLPYKLSTPILSLTGMKWKLNGNIIPTSTTKSKSRGHLYVCNHRTLIDPIYVSIALDKPVTAVSYSLSRLSELLSPIRTIRLSRNREVDGSKMDELLSQGEIVVVCPEGTTCREPYLLRFSPLFTELSDEVIPVAMDVHVSMFYATTAGGFKCLDPIYYLMNPTMCYELEFLEGVDTKTVRSGKFSCIDMANFVQEQMGKALGFECTKLTRKDKYFMLAGNDGSAKRNDQIAKTNLKSR